MGLKGISQTLGCIERNVPVLPSTPSTNRNKAASMGVPIVSLRIVPALLSLLPNSARLHSTPTRAKFFQVEEDGSNVTCGVSSAAVSTSPMVLSIHKWATLA